LCGADVRSAGSAAVLELNPWLRLPNGGEEWSSTMSLITHARTSPIRPQTRLAARRIATRIAGLARASFGSLKPHIETAATILLFTAIMVVLLGIKAAVMLSRMPNLGQ
jgi:hypothetical protein